MGENENALFYRALSAVIWEPLFRLAACEEQYAYYQTMIDCLMEMCFPYKVVTPLSADKPWDTDGFRLLVRKRQRAQEKILRNKVNRAATKLRYDFYQNYAFVPSLTRVELDSLIPKPPWGGVGQFFLGESIYPHMCAKFGRGPSHIFLNNR